ncbi:hypothetical protein AMTR_s00085p00046440 [Amborella trichopoda]|uniref:Uncharacterized protein n=1 Tax=Amborella trichopoda TaxID=13333 RepID=W1NYF1_AMBTC|nr:hypothetical protein AMTR_s00085p00046440 [Amborella trichopoda]
MWLPVGQVVKGDGAQAKMESEIVTILHIWHVRVKELRDENAERVGKKTEMGCETPDREYGAGRVPEVKVLGY